MKTTLDAMKPKDVPEIIENLHQNQQFNQRRGAKHRKFHPGNSVFVKITKKNKSSWVPAEIIESIGNTIYVARIGPKHLVRVHTNQLRLDKRD